MNQPHTLLLDKRSDGGDAPLRRLRSFHLDAAQLDLLDTWIAHHDKTCIYADRRKQGAVGGRLTYEFTPTSLGVIAQVKCACGKHVDVTDYEW